jgi:hypothetical protein
MAKMRRRATAPAFGEWQHGVVLPHTQRDMTEYNARGRVPRPTTHPDDEWDDGPMRPDEVWRPEDTSTKFVGHGERIHALQVTTNDANADLDDPVQEGLGGWAVKRPEPWSWSIHSLHGDDPSNPDHWEHLGNIRMGTEDYHSAYDGESNRGLGRADGQYGNYTHPSSTHPHGDGGYGTSYTNSPLLVHSSGELGGHWGYAQSREEAMHHAEKAWAAHVERTGWGGEGADQPHSDPEPDPFGPRTDLDDDYGDIFGGDR